MTEFHVCQSVSGALKNWTAKEWKMVAADNDMSVSDCKKMFQRFEFEGKKVIPIGEPCDGFSYENGCRGHDIDKTECLRVREVLDEN